LRANNTLRHAQYYFAQYILFAYVPLAGERPAFECSDPGTMLDDMDWFALPSIPHADIAGQLQTIAGDKTKGVAFFDMLKSSPGAKDPEHGFAYQIFGIRPIVAAQPVQEPVQEGVVEETVAPHGAPATPLGPQGKKQERPEPAKTESEPDAKRTKKAGAKK
jgi:hypothetical protein